MLRVKEIDYKIAKGFIEEHHYSHKMPHGYNVCFGWYDGEHLYAVANYGVGVNMMAHEYLAENTTLPVTQFNLFELKRLCRVGGRETHHVIRSHSSSVFATEFFVRSTGSNSSSASVTPSTAMKVSFIASRISFISDRRRQKCTILRQMGPSFTGGCRISRCRNTTSIELTNCTQGRWKRLANQNESH